MCGELPLLYICGDQYFCQMIPVDGSSQYGTQYLYGDQVWDEDENTHIFSSLQAYQKINGLEVTEMDMSKNEYYGISQSVGNELFRIIDEAKPDFVVTDCETCKWQIEMNTKYKVIHRLSLLAEAIE